MLGFQGWGQSFTLATGSFDINSLPINYNCASVTFDCNNNTSSSLDFTVYSSTTGAPGTFSIIFSNTVSPNNISQLTFYNIGTIYYYAEINSSPIITSSIYQVEVRSKPARPTITSNSPICEGSNLIFSTANVTGGTFSWTGVNGFSSSVQNPTISSATTLASGSYSATVTVNGCSSPASTNSVTVNALPVINSLTDTTKVCGVKTVLDAGPGYSTYSWSNGATTRYITTDVTQNYFVTVTNSSNCSSKDSTYLSIIDAKLFNNDTTILSGNSVTLSSHGILNSADRTVVYDFTNTNSLNDFTTLTTSSGTIAITSNGQTGNGAELVRANNCCSDAEMKTLREDFGYGTYEVDAYSVSGISDQSFGIMEQSGSWVNRVLMIGSRPSGTDNPGWDIYFKGVNIGSSGSNPIANNSWYKIKVYITSTTLKVWLDNFVIFDGALPSAITNPRGAIRVGAFDVSRYDNIKYTPYQELSYLWSTSNSTQNITVSPTITTTYQVKVTDKTTTCNASSDIRVLKINIINSDATICNSTTQVLSIDSAFSKYATWQTKKSGIEFYNIKKDLNGNLYALAALNSQKIFKSIDRGETWDQMTGFPNLGGTNFMALGVDQNNVIYASTNNDGIYKSIDEGVSWVQLQDFGGGCGPMDILFGTNFSVLTVKGSNRGIWSSIGDLINWQQKVINFDPNSVTKDIYGNIYSGGNGYDGKVLYKSSDAGVTWNKISSLYGVQIIRSDSNGKVYVIEGGVSPLYLSNNQGASFTKVNDLNLTNSNGSYPEDILFTKNEMFISKRQVYYSKDNGTTFKQLDKINFPTAASFSYGPGGAPSGNYGDSSNRMEIIGNRLFVATLDGIKFIDIDNLNTTVTWSTGQTGNKINVNPVATSPATTVTYSATVAYGATSGTDQVTFTLPTKPTITNSGLSSLCQGNSTTLTANSSPVGIYNYTWQTGETSQNLNVNNSGSYIVTAINSNGCSETSLPYIITVNSLPTVTATSTPASGAICIGSNATLAGAGATSYTWSGGVTNGTAFAPTTTTTYTVTGTDANGCVNTATKSITVNSLPTVTATSTPTSGAICIGSNATLNGVGATSYIWSGGVTNGTAFAPTTTTTYTVTGTDANGCVNTATKSITVNSLPNLTINNPTAVCSPNTIDLTTTAVTTGSTASLVYGYFADAAATAVLGTASAITTSGTYYIKGTDGNSCSSISPVVATINPLPTVTFVATKSKICLGESLSLAGAGASTYSWTGGITNGTLFAPTITTTYTLTGTDINGCVNIASVTIPVNPLPTITQITSSANQLMVGSDLTLNNSASNGLPPYSYIWNNSDPTVAGINGFLNPTLTGIKVGFVDLKYYVIDGNGCRSLTSNLFNVEIIPALMKFEIPNAFIPTDMYMDNKFLKAAYNSSVKRVNYFRVFNRMGKLVYEIQNADPSAIKWDGTYNNVMQESDGYMWIAEITGLGEVTFERKSGQFLLLK